MNVPVVNRTAVFVVPREPYYEWAQALDDDGPMIDDLPRQDRGSAYFIEPLSNPSDVEGAIKGCWSWIFEEMLVGWHRVERDWPPNRTYKLFLEWFEVYLVEPVFDLADMPLRQEEF